VGNGLFAFDEKNELIFDQKSVLKKTGLQFFQPHPLFAVALAILFWSTTGRLWSMCEGRRYLLPFAWSTSGRQVVDKWSTRGLLLHMRKRQSCTLLTTADSAPVAAIHNRMPIILEPGDFNL
jgi:hypothetical protein